MAGTVGIVLAGGGSRRLAGVAPAAGGKAACLFRGRTFLEHVCTSLAAEVEELFVVAAPGQPLPPLDHAHVIRDSLPGAGPLSGLRDAVREATRRSRTADLAVVASCDVPLLRSAIVRLLVAEARRSGAAWTVPVVHGHRQVLVSVISPRLLPRIEDWLAAGRRDLRGLVERLSREDPGAVHELADTMLTAVDPKLDSFLDIDSPEDLRRLIGG